MAPTDGAGGGLSLPPCKGIIKTMNRHGNNYIIAVLSGLLPSHPAGAAPPRTRPQRAAHRHAATHTGAEKKTSLGGAGHQGKCSISWRRPTLPQVNAVPSARQGLTSLFGMGRGDPLRYNHHNVIHIIQTRFISLLAAYNKATLRTNVNHRQAPKLPFGCAAQVSGN